MFVVPPKHSFTLKVISLFPPPFPLLPPPHSLHILYTHTPCLCSFIPVLVLTAHMSPPYIIVPFSSALVYILYTVYFKTDAVYICIHCMPVCVSIVCLPYLCSYHYRLLTLQSPYNSSSHHYSSFLLCSYNCKNILTCLTTIFLFTPTPPCHTPPMTALLLVNLYSMQQNFFSFRRNL